MPREVLRAAAELGRSIELKFFRGFLANLSLGIHWMVVQRIRELRQVEAVLTFLQGKGWLVCLGTDKAVYPSSVMGASKRLAEELVRQTAQRFGCAFMVVRFGNVLGSRGRGDASQRKGEDRQ